MRFHKSLLAHLETWLLLYLAGLDVYISSFTDFHNNDIIMYFK